MTLHTRTTPIVTSEDERLLLALALESPDVAAVVVEKLNPGDFWYQPHTHIRTAIGALVKAGQPVLVPTLAIEMRRRGWDAETTYATNLPEALIRSYDAAEVAAWVQALITRREADTKQRLRREAEEALAANDEQRAKAILDQLLSQQERGPEQADEAPVLLIPRSGAPPLPASAQLPEGLEHGASPWLDRYVSFSRHWSPRSYEGFHEATALWLLSTVAARRVVLHLGGPRYTSLYLALCARTSMYAKSTAAKIASETLQAAGLLHLLAADDATPQAFVRSLTHRVPDGFLDADAATQERTRKKLAFAAQRGWFYDEFGQKVNAMMRDGGFMADFRGLLRRFDDCPASYEYATIGRGNDEVQAPYLALLANLTPSDLRPYAKKGAALWGDGFWARFAFVTPPVDAPRGAGEFPPGERVIPESLTTSLRQWHERLGVPDVEIIERTNDKGEGTGVCDVTVKELSPQACTLGDGVFQAFYRYHDGLLDIAYQGNNADLDGNYARFAEKALRVAMLLASLENGGRVEMQHWAKGQQIAERWRANLHNLIDQLTDEEPTAERTVEDRIIALLTRNEQPLTARDIGRALRGVSAAEAANYLERMVSVGVVELVPSPKTKRYQLSAQEKNNCRRVNTVDVSTSYQSVDTRHNQVLEPLEWHDDDVSIRFEPVDNCRHVDTSTLEPLPHQHGVEQDHGSTNTCRHLPTPDELALVDVPNEKWLKDKGYRVLGLGNHWRIYTPDNHELEPADDRNQAWVRAEAHSRQR